MLSLFTLLIFIPSTSTVTICRLTTSQTYYNIINAIFNRQTHEKK